MLAFRSATAGYVAMELVTGTLDGRAGSFVLQHSGTMDRHAEALSLAVIPDFATGGLERLTGTMRIQRSGAEHSYEFDCRLD